MVKTYTDSETNLGQKYYLNKYPNFNYVYKWIRNKIMKNEQKQKPTQFYPIFCILWKTAADKINKY